MKYAGIAIIGIVVAGGIGVAEARKTHWPAMAMQQSAQQISGAIVQRYIVNPFGEVDGLLLADGWLVKFPAHQSADLTATVSPGDAVSVTGVIAGQRVVEAWTLASGSSNAVLVRTPKSKLRPKMPKHLRAMSLRHLEAQGRITHVVHGKKGEVKIAVLEDGTTLRLGKGARWTVATRIAVGRDVIARGVGTENSYGRGLEVTELGIDQGPVSSIYGAR